MLGPQTVFNVLFRFKGIASRDCNQYCMKANGFNNIWLSFFRKILRETICIMLFTAFNNLNCKNYSEKKHPVAVFPKATHDMYMYTL
jgi:hypothetical protein